MKKIFSLLLVSALGGALTLGGYLMLVKEDVKTNNNPSKSSSNMFLPAVYNSSSLSLAEAPDFVEAAENTIESVVHVKNTAIKRSYNPFSFGYKEQPQVGTGSGVIISPDGYIITNNHVIRGADRISVTFNNNKTVDAKLIGKDENTDLALLKVELNDELPHIVFGDSDASKIGEWVLAIGNPFNLTSTVTAGIISAKSRNLTSSREQSFIQTDAAVNPGNSGGALVNTRGELIGINTAISSVSGSYIGYSFAVPSNIAKKVVQDLMEFGMVQEGILGVSGRGLNNEISQQLNLERTEGFLVNEVDESMGAFKAGIQSGDIITKLDHIKITKFSDLKGYLKSKHPDEIINVEIERNQELKKIPVKLSKRHIIPKIHFMDMELRDISAEIKKQLNIEGGVVVYQSQNKYLERELELQRGSLIKSINGTEIKDLQDIQKLNVKYGNNFQKHLQSMEIIDRYGNRKQFIFR